MKLLQKIEHLQDLEILLNHNKEHSNMYIYLKNEMIEYLKNK